MPKAETTWDELSQQEQLEIATHHAGDEIIYFIQFWASPELASVAHGTPTPELAHG